MNNNLLTVAVAMRTEIAQGIALFHLVSTDGRPLPECAPGAHIDVHLPGQIIRQYSICNTPTATSGYDIAVLKDPNSRGGSQAMHELVQAGQSIQISLPRNMFALAQSANHHVLIAGGIGITPLFSMAEHLHQQGKSFELHYCVRAPERAAFLSELRGAAYKDRVSFYFDIGGDASKLNAAEVLRAHASLSGSHLYICGPVGFIEMVNTEAGRSGVDSQKIHIEHFSGKPTTVVGDQPFEIRLQRSGISVTVPPDLTALEALHNAGIEVPISCAQGICGTCMVKVIEGEIDHRDSYLTDDERNAQDNFLPCCSRAKSIYLTVDL